MVTFPNLNFIWFCYNEYQGVEPLKAAKIPYMDLTICLKGKMHYVYEGKHVILNTGDAILFPQGSVRTRLESTGEAFYCSFNIIFLEDFTPEIAGYLPKSVRSDTIQMLGALRKAFHSVSEEKNHKCTALFWYLYYQLVETTKSNENPHIKNIKNYIANHLTEQITLKNISDAVHLTPQYCCALFVKQTGHTILEFISLQRIEYAKSLIVTTDGQLSDISGKCGFCDYNYFSRMFKKITGISASQYKKEYRK